MEEIIGGLGIKSVNLEKSNEIIKLGHKPYSYSFLSFKNEFEVTLEAGVYYCLHLVDLKNSKAIIKDMNVLPDNTVWHFSKNKSEKIKMMGEGVLLIAEQLVDKQNVSEVTKVYKEEEVKKVSKPWGYELWLTGEPSPVFAFKKIFIKAGTKTSLQYHEFKRETNFLFNGNANLHYNPNEKVLANAFNPSDVAIKLLSPKTTVDVFPMYVHRLEAVTDIMLYEVSTPELDDVIRISDDVGRTSGRINTEHN